MKNLHFLALLPLASLLVAEDTPPPTHDTPVPPPASAAPMERDLSARTDRTRVANTDNLLPTISGQLTLFGGYDNNVLYRVGNDVFSSGDKEASPTGGGEARADWRVINRPGQFLKIGVSGRDDEYSRFHERAFTRYGGSAVWGLVLDPVTPGLAVSGNRYLVDRQGVANDLRAAGTLTRLGTRHVDIAVLEANRLRYDDMPDRAGTLWGASWRHWFLLAESGDISRRLDLGLRGGRYIATLKTEGYWTVRPSASVLWRIGSGETPGTWDLSGGGSCEWRRYGKDADDHSEGQFLPTGELSADRWFAHRITAGAVVTAALRDSSLDSLDYQRWQAYLRLTLRLP